MGGGQRQGTAHAQGARRLRSGLWPFLRTASGLSPAVRIRRPRCGRRREPSRSLPGRKKNGLRPGLLPPSSGRPSRSAKGVLLGSDDEAKAYLNGKQVYKSPFRRRFFAARDAVRDLALNAGLNLLVFKVVNELLDWCQPRRLRNRWESVNFGPMKTFGQILESADQLPVDEQESLVHGVAAPRRRKAPSRTDRSGERSSTPI